MSLMVDLNEHLVLSVDVVERDLICFVEKRYKPEMVFSKQKLEEWAIEHGFVKTTEGV